MSDIHKLTEICGDKKKFDAMTEEERRSFAILGNMRPYKAPEMAAQSMTFDDDLPE